MDAVYHTRSQILPGGPTDLQFTSSATNWVDMLYSTGGQDYYTRVRNADSTYPAELALQCDVRALTVEWFGTSPMIIGISDATSIFDPHVFSVHMSGSCGICCEMGLPNTMIFDASLHRNYGATIYCLRYGSQLKLYRFDNESNLIPGETSIWSSPNTHSGCVNVSDAGLVLFAFLISDPEDSDTLLVGSVGFDDPLSIEQDPGAPLPSSFKLSAFPNPFNASTEIEFEMGQTAPVELTIFDLTGREVETLVNSVLTAGSYRYYFHAKENASGVYFCRMTAGASVETIKMMLLK
jgi:hypothetical protein